MSKLILSVSVLLTKDLDVAVQLPPFFPILLTVNPKCECSTNVLFSPFFPASVGDPIMYPGLPLINCGLGIRVKAV